MKHITKKEFDLIISQNPTNNDLRYLIEYTDLKQEAWAMLIKQNPTNNDLRYLIKYTDLKQEAKKILAEKEKNNQPKKMIDIIKER